MHHGYNRTITKQEETMEQYQVTGMSCAACVSRVEKAVSKVDGVASCSVSLLTNSMGVEGTAAPEAIIAAVQAAGYGASRKGEIAQDAQSQSLQDRETPILRQRLFWSLGFLAVLMYLSMGHMLGLPLPSALHINAVAQGILQLLLAAVVMVINQKFFISGFRSLWHRAPNMDTLVALGSSAAFVYSTAELLRMTAASVTDLHSYHFYFESAAMILTLITVGKMLESRSKGKTTDALRSLMQLSPKTAIVLRNDKETEIPAAQVQKGEIFLVHPGASVPVDGKILEGHSAVDESALTGESIPVDKEVGDMVSAATINQFGFLKCEAVKVGEDTALSQIIRLVSETAATKAPIAKVADKVSGIFVPVVISIALLTLLVWLLTGAEFGYALARAISVLVISCPCALGLATPVAIMVGSGKGARNGILFKTAAALEAAGRTEIIALDKTGTITEGKPAVTGLYPAQDVPEDVLLQTAFSLEQHSEHPLAKAVIDYAKAQNCQPLEVTNFKVLAGNGVSAELDGTLLLGGSLKFIQSRAELPNSAVSMAQTLAEEGKTPLFFCQDGQYLGMIAAADTIKSDSAQAIAQLRGQGIRVVMLTGDNAHTAAAIAKQAGVEEVIADVLPDGKEAVIRRLSAEGRTAMVGDGINDAPALTRADIGIAIGAGTDVAMDAADIVLMKSRLTDVAAAIRLSRATLRNIHQNLFWAFVYNIIGIPLAAGVWIPLFGWELNPMFGAAAMSLSSFCVVSNALRLNLFGMYNADKDTKIKHKKEEKIMTKTIQIEGMMCPHCEATVKKALEALDMVASAEVSHKNGTAVVTLTAAADDELLKKTVEDKDFTVTGIV